VYGVKSDIDIRAHSPWLFLTMKVAIMEPEKVLSILDDLVNSLHGVLSDEDFKLLQELIAEAWSS